MLLIGSLLVDCAAYCGRSESSAAARESGVAPHLDVRRPAVIAYFVIPAGAVDTLPDLAIEADDWNVTMATLRDSLEAIGIDLALVTDSVVRVSVGGRDTALSLGPFKASGYVFVRPDGVRCVRVGGADPDSVKAFARTFAAGGACP
jgi:hypothetical protein